MAGAAAAVDPFVLVGEYDYVGLGAFLDTNPGFDVHTIDRHTNISLLFAIAKVEDNEEHTAAAIDLLEHLVGAESRFDINLPGTLGKTTPVFATAHTGNIAMLEFLVSTLGANLLVQGAYGTTVLHVAVHSDKTTYVEKLIDLLSEEETVAVALSKRDISTGTPIFDIKSVEMLNLLATRGADYHAVKHDGTNLLMHIVATNTDRTALIARLAGLGVDINAKMHGTGTTALHIAVGWNSLPNVTALVVAGAAINDVEATTGQAPISYSQTQAMFQYIIGRPEIVLKDIPAGSGFPSLAHMVVSFPRENEVAAAAEAHGGDFDVVYAALYQQRESEALLMIPKLAAKGASLDTRGTDSRLVALGEQVDPDDRDPRDTTPLGRAILTGRTQAALMLLKFGKKPSILHSRTWPDDRTPLQMATSKGMYAVSAKLVEMGGDTVLYDEKEGKIITDSYGNTALHTAAETILGDGATKDLIGLLISGSHGIPLETLNNNDETALDLAAEMGNPPMTKHLLELGANPDGGSAQAPVEAVFDHADSGGAVAAAFLPSEMSDDDDDEDDSILDRYPMHHESVMAAAAAAAEPDFEIYADSSEDEELAQIVDGDEEEPYSGPLWHRRPLAKVLAAPAADALAHDDARIAAELLYHGATFDPPGGIVYGIPPTTEHAVLLDEFYEHQGTPWTPHITHRGAVLHSRFPHHYPHTTALPDTVIQMFRQPLFRKPRGTKQLPLEIWLMIFEYLSKKDIGDVVSRVVKQQFDITVNRDTPEGLIFYAMRESAMARDRTASPSSSAASTMDRLSIGPGSAFK